jgi:hypothetical protein
VLWLKDAQEERCERSLLEAWIEGVTQGPNPNIYLHPSLVFPADAQAVRPLLYASRGEASDGTSTASFAALAEKTKKIRFVPYRPWGGGFTLRGRRLVGNQLVGDDGEAAVKRFLGQLVRWIRQGGPDSSFVLFEDIEVESPLWRALADETTRRDVTVLYPFPPQQHWWIDFPSNPADYWKKFSNKTRSTFRRKAAQLKHSLRCFSQPAEVSEFLEKAHEVSGRSWQAKRQGLRIANSEGERRLFHFLASQNAWRSYVLESDQKPLAFVVGIQWRGTFTFDESGFDTAYADQSPGTVLLYRLLEDLIARDTPQRFDFGSGDGGHKQLFGNRQTMSGPVLLFRRGVRPLLAWSIMRAQYAVSKCLRACLKQGRLLSVVRKLYRR